MQIATIVFTYNRSIHTEKVLTALSQNETIPEKLFLFQDGLKKEEHRKEWEKVNNLIKKVDWCDCEVIVSGENKGLSESIVCGINYVFQDYDAVIVLEDDCVPQPSFMTFMYQSLEKYACAEDVYTINGYTYPIEVQGNGTDAYFIRRACSWGWGIWKERWSHYEQNYRMLGHVMNDSELAEQLHVWGEDLESYLLGNIYGNCDSWAVFLALMVIERRGYCLYPYKSLIKNIGFDGTGVHSKIKEKKKEPQLNSETVCDFALPEKIEIPKGCEGKFADFFSWISPGRKTIAHNELLWKWVDYLADDTADIAARLQNRGISKCSIWGKGPFCELLLRELCGKLEVLSIIESHPIDEAFNGIPVVSVDRVPKETQMVIVVPTYDFEKIKRLAESVIDCEIISCGAVFEI